MTFPWIAFGALSEISAVQKGQIKPEIVVQIPRIIIILLNWLKYEIMPTIKDRVKNATSKTVLGLINLQIK